VLAVHEIYEDARKGLRVAREDLLKVFGTENVEEIAKRIIKEGSIQLTVEQRRRMLEEKKRQIASIIAREAINPQTNAPHPIERILSAMEMAKVNVDIFKPAEEQVKDVVSAIQRYIPLRFEKVTLQIKIPAQYSGKCYGTVKSLGNIKREEWLGDGSLYVEIEIPAGMQNEVYDKLNSLTSGNVYITKKG
jgi:ribosome maturation protein SDO1